MPKKSEINEIIIGIADEVDIDKISPTCAYYEREVAKKLSEKYKREINPRKKHRDVHRILNQLADKKRLIRLGNEYYPNNPEYRRRYYGNCIKEKVQFEQGNVHKITENTCVVKLKKRQNSRQALDQEVLEFFEGFIGKDNCYSLKKDDSHLIIMLQNNLDPNETNLNHIAELVKTVYEAQPKRNRNLMNALRDLLGKDYDYYWFDKEMNDGALKRRFLFLECTADVTNDVHEAIVELYSDWYISIYRGYKGLVITFDVTSMTENFDKFITHIKKQENNDNKE